ncbi:10529_t:CDS:2, partial [Scutellospora calospora]
MSDSTTNATIEHKSPEDEFNIYIMEFLSTLKSEGETEEELDPEARSDLIKEIIELQGGLK